MFLDWFTFTGVVSAVALVVVMFKLCARHGCGRQ